MSSPTGLQPPPERCGVLHRQAVTLHHPDVGVHLAVDRLLLRRSRVGAPGGGTGLARYVEPGEFVQLGLQSGGYRVTATADKAAMLTQIKKFVEHQHSVGRTVVLIIDEGQCLSIDEFEEIRLLTDFVDRGGRLAIFTDATRGMLLYDYNTGAESQFSDSNAVNPLLAPFGISLRTTLNPVEFATLTFCYQLWNQTQLRSKTPLLRSLG